MTHPYPLQHMGDQWIFPPSLQAEQWKQIWYINKQNKEEKRLCIVQTQRHKSVERKKMSSKQKKKERKKKKS